MIHDFESPDQYDHLALSSAVIVWNKKYNKFKPFHVSPQPFSKDHYHTYNANVSNKVTVWIIILCIAWPSFSTAEHGLTQWSYARTAIHFECIG